VWHLQAPALTALDATECIGLPESGKMVAKRKLHVQAPARKSERTERVEGTAPHY